MILQMRPALTFTTPSQMACLLAASMMCAQGAQAAQPQACRTSHHRVGECRTVHGRMQIGNGTPAARIWIVGTKRMIGVWDPAFADPESVESQPAPLRRAFASAPFRTRAYGDFEVCPFTRDRPGWMQMACIASVGRLVVRRDPL
jgi:hypothetical protein